jgi:diguanylate cyclase (GGDEF)-like protein/PAS domain S-box-containing protein
MTPGVAFDSRTDSERRLRLERGIGALLLHDEGTEATLVAALRAVCESEGWAAGKYWRLDEADDVLRIHAAWSADDERLGRVLRQALQMSCGSGVGLAGEVMRSREPLWIPHLARDPRAHWTDLADQTGWNSALLAPVFWRRRVVGVLDFNAAQISAPDEQLLDLLQALGAQIGHFYSRAVMLDRLRESEERYATLVELAAIGISHVDVDGRFVHVNRQLCEMLGYTRDELLALSVRDISHPDDRHSTDKQRAQLHAGEIDSFKAEKRYVRKDGTPVWVHLTVRAKRGSDGRRVHDISIVEDITERREAQSRVEYLATHDEMTGLANRTLFSELLARAVARERRHRRKFAVLFLDLDRFKIVNDSLGHDGGDKLLKVVASRLGAGVRSSDVMARFGGDEFVLLAHEIPDRQTAAIVARHLLSLILKPVAIGEQQCRVTASIGIAVYPDDAADATTLLKRADMALYRAKEEGKNTFQFYSPDLGARSEERMRIETCLRDAVARNELSLHYQAKVDMKTGAIRGVEALLRWTHPELGSVSPTQFIPVAEECGLIVPLGQWAMTTACAQSVAWLREGLPPICMAVNLSPRQFLDPNLVAVVADVLARTGIQPHLLELEITESVMSHDMDAALAKLTAIRTLGVRLAIDDFGTGYSSLAQLKRFPIDVLKIDRSFIKGIPSDKEDIAITEAILALAGSLGVRIVAEGVETREQQAFLEQHDCDEMQGFYFSRPVPPDDFARLLRTQSTGSAGRPLVTRS